MRPGLRNRKGGCLVEKTSKVLIAGAQNHVGFNPDRPVRDQFVEAVEHLLDYILADDDPPDFPTTIKAMRKIDPKVPGALMIVPKALYGTLPFFDWFSNKTLGAPRTITAEFAKSFKSGDLLADNSKAKRELGWAQTVSLERSLRNTMAEFKGAA